MPWARDFKQAPDMVIYPDSHWDFGYSLIKPGDGRESLEIKPTPEARSENQTTEPAPAP
ncbi:MAG: hypothetical protein GWO81_04000 [Verrucomicrobia bacterium]|nr:hypothetical protein [Verrucomicrobiota bacterium]